MAAAERDEVNSDAGNEGLLFDVRWVKEVMGKKWRRRDGDGKLETGDDGIEQDIDMERLIWK